MKKYRGKNLNEEGSEIDWIVYEHMNYLLEEGIVWEVEE